MFHIANHAMAKKLMYDKITIIHSHKRLVLLNFARKCVNKHHNYHARNKTKPHSKTAPERAG